MIKKLISSMPVRTRIGLKKFISAILTALPKEFSSRMRFALRFLYSFEFGREFFLTKTAKAEKQRIESAIKKGIQKALLTYDLKNAPTTYGDFLYLVFLVRYLTVKGVKAEVAVLGWNAADRPLYNSEVVSKFKTLVRHFCGEDQVVFKYVKKEGRNEYFGRLVSAHRNQIAYVPFSRLVLRDKATYKYLFLLVNYLSVSLTKDERESFLVAKPKNNSETLIELGPFVALHCRCNPSYGLDRNIREKDFELLILQIKEGLPNHRIVVVTDFKGREEIKNFSAFAEYHCVFSKSGEDDFISNSEVALNADLFISYKGGGILVTPLFSLQPYIILGNRRNEVAFPHNKYTLWQTENQFFGSPDLLEQDFVKTCCKNYSKENFVES